MRRFSPNKLYKDPERGKILGVCAGLSDYTGIKVNVIRCLTVIACIVWFIPVAPIYLIMGLVLDSKPRDLYKNPEEERFWRDVRTRPNYTTVEMKTRFRGIDKRLQRIESYITSRRFRLDRDLRDLEN